MAICDFCGESQRGGHVRVGRYRFCRQTCADQGRILQALDAFPSSAINSYVEKTPADQQVNPLLARLASKLKSDSRVDVSLLNSDEVKPERYSTYCLTWISMWTAVLDFPRKDREILLRALYR